MMPMSDDHAQVIIARLDFQDRILADIRVEVKETKAQAVKTNGRVTALERFQARLEGAQQAMSWRAPLIVGVVCAAVGAGVAALLG